MNLPHVLQDFLHDRAVARDDRDAPVAAQVADDAPGLGEDQFGGADVPFVQRQFPVAVQQSGGWVLRPTTSAASPPDCWTATGNWRCTNGTSAPPN